MNEPEFIDLAARWITRHPTAGDLEACEQVAAEISGRLRTLDFVVERFASPGQAPMLVAQRRAAPGRAAVGIYGHYDVEPAGEGWSHDALTLRECDGRIYGRGIADNLGPLALRLLAAREVSDWPGVVWVIEGGEELGSPALASYLREHGARPDIALWLDETGYFANRDVQRRLTLHWTASLAGLDHALSAAAPGIAVHREVRRLRRVSPPNAAAVERLFGEAPYLAIGPNDPEARVHGIDESLPRWSLTPSAAQFVAVLEWFARVAR